MNIKTCIGILSAGLCIGMLGACGGGGGSGSSTGSVRSSTITGRAVNSSGAPVSGARVALSTAGRASKQAVETTTTDVNGNFTLTNVAAGTYTVSVSETLPSGSVETVLVTVTVPDGTTINLTIDLSTTENPEAQTGSVVGTVTDDTGAPVVGASVSLHSQTDATLPVLTTTTDSTGSFSFATVTTGLWLVQVNGRHITSTSRQLTEVEAGAASQVNLTVSVNGNGNENGNGND